MNAQPLKVCELVSRIPRVMKVPAWPAVCGRGTCHHPACITVRDQAALPCGVCHQVIKPGERYIVIAVESFGRVRTQIHESCSEPLR